MQMAEKRAEVEQLNKLRNENALKITSAFRGHIGRRIAKSLRNEMIELIAQVRVEDAVIDQHECIQNQNRLHVFWESKLRGRKSYT